MNSSVSRKRWLGYPVEEEPTNSPFYGQLSSIGVADLLWFVAERTGFQKSFAHVLERYVIHYNTLILSRVYEQKLAAGDPDAVRVGDGIARGSLIICSLLFDRMAYALVAL
ncbi:MAG: hypothetical protein ACXV7J_15130 [Methylomonas sp.]